MPQSLVDSETVEGIRSTYHALSQVWNEKRRGQVRISECLINITTTVFSTVRHMLVRYVHRAGCATKALLATKYLVYVFI